MTPSEQEQELFDLFNKGIKYFAEYTGNRENTAALSAACDVWQRVDRKASQGSRLRPILEYHLGMALLRMAQNHSNLATCRLAIAKLTIADCGLNITSGGQPVVLSELAAAHVYLFDLSRDLKVATAALEVFDRLAMTTLHDPNEQIVIDAQRAQLLLWRFNESPSRFSDDLPRAINYLLSAWKTNRAFLVEKTSPAGNLLKEAVRLGLESKYSRILYPDLTVVAEEECSSATPDSEDQAEWMTLLAWALYERFRDLGKPEDELAAHGWLRKMLSILAQVRNRTAGGFYLRFIRLPPSLQDRVLDLMLLHHEEQDLKAAIKLHPELHQVIDTEGRMGETLLSHWQDALKLDEEYRKTFRLEDGRQVVALYGEIIASAKFQQLFAEQRAMILLHASTSTYTLYWFTGELEMLESALKQAREAYACAIEFDKFSRDKDKTSRLDRSELFVSLMTMSLPSTCALTLGAILTEAHMRGTGNDYLTEAVQRCREGIELRRVPIADNNLGNWELGYALQKLFQRDGVTRYLLEALEYQEKAVIEEGNRIKHSHVFSFDNNGKLFDGKDAPHRFAHMLNEFGCSYQLAYKAKLIKSIEPAIECHRNALSLLRPTAPSYPRFMGSLFDDLVLSGTVSAHNEIRRLQKDSAEIPNDLTHHLAILDAKLGTWAFDQSDWSGTVKSMQRLSAARDHLQILQTGLTAKQVWLAVSQGEASQHAYALAKLYKLAESFAVLERGLVRLISEAMRWRGCEIQRLRDLEPDLHAKLLAAQGKVEKLEALTGTYMGSLDDSGYLKADVSRRSTWSELQTIEESIRKKLGKPRWLSEERIEDIQQRLLSNERHALVYLMCTNHGALATIVTKSGVTSVWPPMQARELDEILFGKGEFGLRYVDYIVVKHRNEEAFNRLLVKVLGVLGERLMAPIADYLRGIKMNRVTLVPIGRLNLLPLDQARWRRTERWNTFSELYITSFLPSVMTRLSVPQSEKGGLLKQITLFGNPMTSTPSSKSLAAANAEVNAIKEILRTKETKLWIGTSATRDNFYQALSEATLIHFAGHGTFNAAAAIKSQLLLADGAISVQELLDSGVQPRLGAACIMSACQTSLVDFKALPDECLGFPATLLAVGFSEVIGSLWPVRDGATSILMVKLFELLTNEYNDESNLSTALNIASNWLRQSTTDEVNEFSTRHNLGIALPKTLSMEDYPSYWSAFISFG